MLPTHPQKLFANAKIEVTILSEVHRPPEICFMDNFLRLFDLHGRCVDVDSERKRMELSLRF